jgi:hypothetical protein
MTAKNVIKFDNSLRCIRHCIFVLNCGSNTNYCNIILPYIESNLPKLDWIFRFWSFFFYFFVNYADHEFAQFGYC